jgi:hypothetical protein
MGTRRGDPTRRRRLRLGALAVLAGTVGVVRKAKLDAADAAFPEASQRIG